MPPKYDAKSKKTMSRRKKCPDPPSSSSSSSESEPNESETEYSTVDENDTSESSEFVLTRKKNKKYVVNSDTEDDDDGSYESDFVDKNDSGKDGALSENEIRRQIAKMFPSKYMSDKLKKTVNSNSNSNSKRHKKAKYESSSSSSSSSSTSIDEDTESSCDRHYKKKKHHHSRRKDKKSKSSSKRKHSKKTKKEKRVSSEEDEDESDDDDFETEDNDEFESENSSYDDDDDDDDDFDDDDEATDKQKLNIFLTIGGGVGGDDDEDEFNAEQESDDNDEDCGSDAEKTFMKENYQQVLMPDDSKDSCDSSDKSKKNSKNKRDKKSKSKKDGSTSADANENEKEKEPTDIEKEYLELLDLKKHLNEKLHKNPKSKILRNAIKECTISIRKLIKNARSQNTKMYYEMTRPEKKRTNEIDYFKKKLSNKEQLKIMRDLKEINQHINIEKPYRLSLLQSKIPAKFKAVAMHKLNMLRNMEPGDPEYHKVKNWVDTFMKIPFGTYKNLSININDGIEACGEFLDNAKKTLDDCVFGLDDAKLQIMQMLGQWITNPSALGTAIAIKGAMGTGKTTLVKEGISKILGREFAFIALGGASDSSFLEGHSYTYEGSIWGKIVQILIDSKCMNPVIYFDELDKISDTAKGQEIVGILTHLTDTSQNSQFHDKYFSEIDFDLSKCLFIFSYNDENLVNPILRDRMYRIQTKGYDTKEKTVITKNYLLPKIREQVGFNNDEIIIPDDTIQYIVSSSKFTKSEEGVRNLKRCLEIIYTKLNLFRLMKPSNPLLKQHMQMEVEFPFTVLRKHVDILIKSDEYQNQSFLAMYV
jgi:ATP-dependent Lon protease